MTDRYFLPDLQHESTCFELPPEEAAHATKVMRLHVGDALTVFDGCGWQGRATIERISKHSVSIEVSHREPVSREIAPQIHLGVPLPKGDRAKWLVEKLTELGTAELTAVECQHLQGTYGHGDSHLQKLRRTVIEASKQCGRNQLMDINPPCGLQPYLSLPDRADAARDRSVPSGQAPMKIIALPDAAVELGAILQGLPGSIASGIPRQWWILVGPEGGFSADEVRQAREAGWCGVRLGPSILRVETAAVAIVARIALDRA